MGPEIGNEAVMARRQVVIARWALPIKWFIRFTCVVVALATAGAAQAQSGDDSSRRSAQRDSLSKPDEPSKLLIDIQERGKEKDSLLPVSPLGWLHDLTDAGKKELYDATNIDLGFALTHVFQGITDSLPGEDDWGTATTADLVASWDLLNPGEPTQGQVVAHVQGRWQYGDITAPEDLGFGSLASGIGTADTFAEYTPSLVLRNLYWRHGSPEAGWGYRAGKITPDGILSSSDHLDSQITFLPSGSVSSLAIGFPDSGFGAVAGWYINDRMAVAGLVSDANADRFDFGEVDEGDLFAAAEFQFKVAPQTPKAGYSKLTVWHTDGTKDGQAINASTGESGWGFFIKHEQELTSDGRAVGILRYGKSFNDSAFYEQQAGAHLLFYEPRVLTQLKNDVVGVAFNWADSSASGTRSEYSAEAFYRFPLFPQVDTTFSYQSVINPAFTRDIDHASVFSLRLRVTF